MDRLTDHVTNQRHRDGDEHQLKETKNYLGPMHIAVFVFCSIGREG